MRHFAFTSSAILGQKKCSQAKARILSIPMCPKSSCKDLRASAQSLWGRISCQSFHPSASCTSQCNTPSNNLSLSHSCNRKQAMGVMWLEAGLVPIAGHAACPAHLGLVLVLLATLQQSSGAVLRVSGWYTEPKSVGSLQGAPPASQPHRQHSLPPPRSPESVNLRWLVQSQDSIRS